MGGGERVAAEQEKLGFLGVCIKGLEESDWTHLRDLKRDWCLKGWNLKGKDLSFWVGEMEKKEEEEDEEEEEEEALKAMVVAEEESMGERERERRTRRLL